MPKKIFIITAIIVAIIVFGAAATYITQKPGGEKVEKEERVATLPEEPVVESQKPTIPEAIDISDWKVYRNEEYGFEIKYPKGSRIYPSWRKNAIASLVIQPPFDRYFDDVWLITHKDLKIVLRDESYTECLPPVIRRESEILKINDITFYLTKAKSFAMGGETDYGWTYSTYHNNICFELWFDIVSYRLKPAPENLPDIYSEEEFLKREFRIFDKMLSTFRFIK